MNLLKTIVGVVSLLIAVNSFAANKKSRGTLNTTTLSSTLPQNLLVPSFKSPDPMLGGGGALHSNFADCPFKSQAGKYSNTAEKVLAGKIADRITPGQRDQGNR